MADGDGSRSTGDELQPVAARLRAALAENDPAALGELLHALVTWGDCAGPDAVLEFVAAATSAGIVARDLTIEVIEDRIVAEFATGDGTPRVTQAIFVRDGQISEIIDATDRAHAISLRPVGDLTVAAERGWRADRPSPVLPVVDLAAAVDRYRLLGFDVRLYEGQAAYAFAARGPVELHLAQVDDLSPSSNTSACYLYVDDADAAYAAWRLAGVDGRLTPPSDTEYGLREGAYVDPDGNLVRFGSAS